MLRHHFLESLFSILAKRQNRIFTLRQNNVPDILLNLVLRVGKEPLRHFPRFRKSSADNGVYADAADDEPVEVFKDKISGLDAEGNHISTSARGENRVIERRI